jgi:hypothetical protein
MSKKAPRVNKTKEDIIQHQVAVQIADKRRAFVKEKIFPLLQKQGQDIAKTKIMIEVIISIINQTLENKKKDYKMSDLKLLDLIKDDHNDVTKYYREVLELLNEENVQDVTAMIGDFSYILDGYARSEFGKKNINEVDLNVIVY